MGSWNMQEQWDLDLSFWFGDGRICGVSSPLCVLAPRTQTCLFFIARKNEAIPMVCHRESKKRPHPWNTHYQFSINTLYPQLHFLRRIYLLSPLRIWQLCVPKSYKVFMEPPDAIVTP